MLDDLHPDAEIYVDASKHGLGAYLLTSEDDTIRWISDRWTNKTYFDPIKYTTIAEFYALVTAIYTWKHKFLGKKVLCYSDCLSAVHLVNNGLYVVRNNRTNRRIDPRNEKLFKTLINTCEKYDITLFARHVNRVNNVPADLLSRSDVKSFQEIVPTAFHIPKKSKKLDFCKPKDDDYLNPEDRKRKWHLYLLLILIILNFGFESMSISWTKFSAWRHSNQLILVQYNLRFSDSGSYFFLLLFPNILLYLYC